MHRVIGGGDGGAAQLGLLRAVADGLGDEGLAGVVVSGESPRIRLPRFVRLSKVDVLSLGGDGEAPAVGGGAPGVEPPVLPEEVKSRSGCGCVGRPQRAGRGVVRRPGHHR